jgi:hypothetical protein
MNARVQQLAEQARQSIPQGRLTVAEWIQAYNEELARLIVEDALAVCDQVAKGFEDWSLQHAIDSTQRQIGVNHVRLALKQQREAASANRAHAYS